MKQFDQNNNSARKKPKKGNFWEIFCRYGHQCSNSSLISQERMNFTSDKVSAAH